MEFSHLRRKPIPFSPENGTLPDHAGERPRLPVESTRVGDGPERPGRLRAWVMVLVVRPGIKDAR
jgi:hypothetical protein